MQQKNSFIILRDCLVFFKSYKIQIFFACLGMLFFAAANGGTAYLIKPALDDIFINKNSTALTFIPIAIVVVFLLQGVGGFAQNCLMAYCSMKVTDALRRQVFDKIIELPVGFFNETPLGKLMSRVFNDIPAVSASLTLILDFFRKILTVIALICVLFSHDWKLALLSCFVFPLALYPIIFIGKKLRRLGHVMLDEVSNITASLQESLSGVMVIKAFATEEREKKNFATYSDKLVQVGLKQTIYAQLSSPFMEFLGSVGAGLIVYYGGMEVISGTKTPGEFFSFLTALFLLYKPLKEIVGLNVSLQAVLVSGERYFEIVNSPAIQIERSGNCTFSAPLKKLEIVNVSFSYPRGDKPALRNISFEVNCGETVALVGKSGAGKTSLINLIPRFYDCNSGSIFLNGKNIQDYTLHSLRTNIGIVSQDAFLFNMSAKENIAYGRPEATMDEIEQAARAAYAHDFICELPDGYDTVLGERGVKLSGGQKQRLTIARAILKNPTLLILDEATSALDSEAERIVQQALNNLISGRTSLVIAHRLSTILNADRIVVMENGEILDIAPHAKLLERCSVYKNLYNIQFHK